VRGLAEDLDLLVTGRRVLLAAAVIADEQALLADDPHRRTAVAAIVHDSIIGKVMVDATAVALRYPCGL
jgi:hypothetical protein